MSMTFTKLFNSITESTVWQEDHPTRITWITMLAMADHRGRIHASIPGLANRARVTVPECEAALKKFMSPDIYSRTRDFEGRRIEEIDGGWRLLNYDKYRSIKDEESVKDSKRRWAREYREREVFQAATSSLPSESVETNFYSRTSTPENNQENEVQDDLLSSQNVDNDFYNRSASNSVELSRTPSNQEEVEVEEEYKDKTKCNATTRKARCRQRNETPEEIAESLKPYYPSIDVDHQLRLMRAWLTTPKGKHRQLTRRFMVSWLSRVEPPIKIEPSPIPAQTQPFNELDNLVHILKTMPPQIAQLHLNKFKQDGKLTDQAKAILLKAVPNLSL